MKTTKEVIQEARALIQTGWCQGANHKKIAGRDHHCLRGAILKSLGDAAHTRFGWSKSYIAALEAFRSGTGQDVIVFNDVVAKDKRQVLRVLDRIVARLP